MKLSCDEFDDQSVFSAHQFTRCILTSGIFLVDFTGHYQEQSVPDEATQLSISPLQKDIFLPHRPLEQHQSPLGRCTEAHPRVNGVIQPPRQPSCRGKVYRIITVNDWSRRRQPLHPFLVEVVVV